MRKEGSKGQIKGEGVARFMWRITRRWKWSIAAILMSLLMIYVLFWVNNPLMMSFLGTSERFAASYFTLFFVFFLIIAIVLYELNVKASTYYVCENCYKPFVLDGHQDPDARCPFCSSKDLHVLMTATKKDQKFKGLIWNPPPDD